MLTIYPFILETLTIIQPLAVNISRKDADLGRQLRRAASSIALNVAEGQYSRGKNREVRYHSALGSARESLACFEIATAMGYAPALPGDVADRFDRIIATLVRLSS